MLIFCVFLPLRDEGQLHTWKVSLHFPGSASQLQLASFLYTHNDIISLSVLPLQIHLTLCLTCRTCMFCAALWSSPPFLLFDSGQNWVHWRNLNHTHLRDRQTGGQRQKGHMTQTDILTGYCRVQQGIRQYRDHSLRALIGRYRSRGRCEWQTNMEDDQKLYPVWAGDTGSTCRQTGRHHLSQVYKQVKTCMTVSSFDWQVSEPTWWCPQRAGRDQEGKTWH